MNGDLLLLVFDHAQPGLWQGEWFMNLINSAQGLLFHSVKRKVVSVATSCV